MKRSEQITHFQALSLSDLQKEIFELQKKIQTQTMAIGFGKSKQVRTVRNLKRELARGLTFASSKLQAKEDK